MQIKTDYFKQIKTQYQASYNAIYRKILKYKRIAVFAHASPDYDALGTQMGLTTWLRDNFPEKEIVALGQNHVVFTPRLYPSLDVVSEEWLKKPFLAIVVDTGNADRVADQRFHYADFVIKIDHHPAVEQYGDLNLVNTSMCATSELIADFIVNCPRKANVLSKEAAVFLYTGIAGDSGRFQYSSTTPHTFMTAAMLMDTGIDLSRDVYLKMYGGTLNDLYVMSYILNHFSVTKNGVAYYVLSDEDLNKLNIPVERGKENVNLFAETDGINAWASITEDRPNKKWRVSLRSKEKSINGVAAHFHGGGHPQASGATLFSLDELPKLIEELDMLFAK
jgi:phosphoesterase RecJ-like protein